MSKAIRFEGGLSGLLRQALGQNAPHIGDQVRVGLRDFLKAPPEQTMWHRPGASDTFTLHSIFRRPVLEAGDVIGLRKGDPKPKAPSGTELVRIADPNVSADQAEVAAVLYKVVPFAPSVAAFAIRPRGPQLAAAAGFDWGFPPAVRTAVTGAFRPSQAQGAQLAAVG